MYSITNNLTIDLNGHDIVSELNNPLFSVSNGASLTLKGSTGSVTNSGPIGHVTNNGFIVVEDGTYTSEVSTCFLADNGGSITINDGLLTGAEGVVNTNAGNGIVIINGGDLVSEDKYVLASDGTEGHGGNVFAINGGTLEGNTKSVGYEAAGIIIANNDTLVVNGGEITANGGTAICMRAGSVTINDGTIIATDTDKSGNTVEDGAVGDDLTILTGCSAIVFHETSNYPGQLLGDMALTVTGGTITGINHSIQVLSNAAEPNVVVTGGTLTPVYPEVVVGE